jgi:hypothetical protein
MTDLVNSMLDTAGLSKAWFGEALLTSCYVLNKVPMKSKEKTPYEEWIGRKPSLFYLHTWGCFAKVNVSINKKRKLARKIVDYIFLGYAHHSIAYRFLVIKSEIPDVYIDTFLESRDVIFFENIFLMKNRYGMSSLRANVLADTSSEPSGNFDHTEYTPEPIHEEIDSEAPRRSKRPRTAKSFGDDFTIYLRHLHLLIQMIGKKRSIVRWTQFSLMELGSWLIDHIVINLWVVNGCLQRSLGQMVLLIGTRQALWPRVIPKRKAKISLILIHLLLD